MRLPGCKGAGQFCDNGAALLQGVAAMAASPAATWKKLRRRTAVQLSNEASRR
jgi:hypothetical protein